MSEWDWIDLRGRGMLHLPWAKASKVCTVRPGTLIGILDAYVSRGGRPDALCGLLNSHVPNERYSVSPDDLRDTERHYSLEYYFYLFTFAKILLGDPQFRYNAGTSEQLDVGHHILEQGPMKYPPWRYESGGEMNGYLSITNMRSMFAYVEEELAPPEFSTEEDRAGVSLRLSREGLAFLNACAPAAYRVERSFFDNEEVLISFEYLFYISNIFELLTNDDRFVYHALYYGYLHNNQIARSIFLQPSISPVEGFRQWQARTNNVYRMELRHKGSKLSVTIHLRKQLQTGMFGLYRESCTDGIRQACPAVYRAFMELATGGPVKASVRYSDTEPDSFVAVVRWRPRLFSLKTVLSAVVGGLGVVMVVIFLPHLRIVVAGLLFGVLAAFATAGQIRLRYMEKQSRETRKVIDDQYRSLKAGADRLLEERDGLEEKVKERTNELEDAFRRLQALDEAKTNFIANVSHELRTPLTLLLVPLEGIRSGRYGTTIQENHPVFGLLERNVRRLSNEVNQLLDFARLDLGTMPFEPQPLDLVGYSRDLVGELQSLAERKGIKISLENRSGSDRMVILADESLLETALLNLLSNAIKFTDEGEVLLILETTAASVRLVVHDTGIGFCEEEKERLFERFVRGSSDSDRHREGTGLGLALTREIAARHSWALEAEGRPGEGADFSLTIPLHDGDALSIPTTGSADKRHRLQRIVSGLTLPEQTETPVGAVDERELILLVEDNPDMTTVLKSLLDDSYRVVVSRSGVQALDFIRSGTAVSLIICDVMMPGMNGFELRSRLNEREEWRKLPFVFLTALANTEDRLEGLESGALDYICKPFSGDELLLKVRNILDTHNASYQQALSDARSAERLVRLSPPPESAASGVSARLTGYGITPAELRVLELLKQGLQDKEIASRLSLSARTVSSHLGRLYQKTGAGNRVELLSKIYGTFAG